MDNSFEKIINSIRDFLTPLEDEKANVFFKEWNNIEKEWRILSEEEISNRRKIYERMDIY